MDPFRHPPRDTLAAARLHVRALTDCGLPKEALLRAILEMDGDVGSGNNKVTQKENETTMAAKPTTTPGPTKGPAASPTRRDDEMDSSKSSCRSGITASSDRTRDSSRFSLVSTSTSLTSSRALSARHPPLLPFSAPAANKSMDALPTMRTKLLGCSYPASRSVEVLSSAAKSMSSKTTAPGPLETLPRVSSPLAKSTTTTSATTYLCTFCPSRFPHKSAWKTHLEEQHDRWTRYPCPAPQCGGVFWSARAFANHHRSVHGCYPPAPDAAPPSLSFLARSMKHMRSVSSLASKSKTPVMLANASTSSICSAMGTSTKASADWSDLCPHTHAAAEPNTARPRAWACGFCAAFVPGRTCDRYAEHVAAHFEAGCLLRHPNHTANTLDSSASLTSLGQRRLDWTHSRVVYGLLHQKGLHGAWTSLMGELYGHLPREKRPLFAWDEKRTGRGGADDEDGLLDMLEFFHEKTSERSQEKATKLARLAHDMADILYRSDPSANRTRDSDAKEASTWSRAVLACAAIRPSIVTTSKDKSAPQQRPTVPPPLRLPFRACATATTTHLTSCAGSVKSAGLGPGQRLSIRLSNVLASRFGRQRNRIGAKHHHHRHERNHDRGGGAPV